MVNEQLVVLGDIPETLMKLVEDNLDKGDMIEQDYQFIDDRRGTGKHVRDYWIFLKPGWCWIGMGWHMIHESSIKEIRRCIGEIQPCDEYCATCRQEANNVEG